MSTECSWPTCHQSATHGAYCFLHGRTYGTTVKVKEPKPLPKKSDKRKQEDKAYRKAKLQLVADGKDCQINSPVCIGEHQGAHHIQKTSPNNRADINNLLRSCNPCNDYIEEHPKWAEENGFTKSRFK